MRRCVLLAGGLCASFCILWNLLSQFASVYSGAVPVLSIVPAVQSQSAQELQFPFKIPGTTLIAERIVSYDGRFFEGDTVCDVVNVAALMLYNYGANGITGAEVELRAGGISYVFAVDTLPSGQRLLVPERDGKEYGPDQFTSIRGTQTESHSDWMMEQLIKLEYPDMGEVIVTNRTEQTLKGIYLLYKNYLPESDFYVGGKSGLYYIQMLAPGESIRIYPRNYAYSYSRFARIIVEDYGL